MAAATPSFIVDSVLRAPAALAERYPFARATAYVDCAAEWRSASRRYGAVNRLSNTASARNAQEVRMSLFSGVMSCFLSMDYAGMARQKDQASVKTIAMHSVVCPEHHACHNKSNQSEIRRRMQDLLPISVHGPHKPKGKTIRVQAKAADRPRLRPKAKSGKTIKGSRFSAGCMLD
jgi:hypothetical protein